MKEIDIMRRNCNKRNLLVLSMLLLVSFITKAQDPDTLFEKKNDVASDVKKFKDSLVENGIDTLLVYQSSCSDCVSHDSVPDKIFVRSSPYSESTPSYVFWIDNNHYYVKKFDEFFNYSTLESYRHHHYPLYDFYFYNAREIQSERIKIDSNGSLNSKKS